MKLFGQSIYQTEGGPFLPIKGEFASTRKENKTIFIVPRDYENENDVIIELQTDGSTSDMALVKSQVN